MWDSAGPIDCFGVCGERRKVLYATDDFVAGAQLMGLSEAQLRSTERRQTDTVDLVIGVSAPLVEK